MYGLNDNKLQNDGVTNDPGSNCRFHCRPNVKCAERRTSHVNLESSKLSRINPTKIDVVSKRPQEPVISIY